LSLLATHITHLLAVAGALLGVCAGFFSIHAAAAGSLNRKLAASRGRANSLYVLCYYLGGTVGITLGGYGYQAFHWVGVTGLGLVMLLLILILAIGETRA
jgi:YNFM family putative membrane transporter